MTARLVLTTLLIVFGLFNLFGIRPALVENQLVFVLIALIVYFLVRRVGWMFARNNANLLYWIFVGLVAVTYIIGFEVKGSRRWIDLYFFSFQASEFLKIFFIVHLSNILTHERHVRSDLSLFLKSLLYLAPPAILIFLQPDLGNAMVYVAIFLSLVLFSAVPKKYLMVLLLIVVLFAPLGYVTLKDYQKERLTSFLNKSADTQGASYNMIQAVITTGSGRMLGRGLGHGTQSRLRYLPENHTDFAFSSLVEQFGFVGGGVVIGLFFMLILAFFRRASLYMGARSAEDQYLFLYTIGFTTYFLVQTSINIGMNMGLVPVVGIALPFISYGGSSIVTLAIGLALIP